MMEKRLKALSTKRKAGENKSAQASFEYLMIIGIIAVIMVPLLIVYSTHIQGSTDEVETAQIMQLARHIVDASDSVYFLGEPSQTQIKAQIPKNVVASTVTGREIIFKISSAGKSSDVVQISSANLSGSLPSSQGIYTITLKAEAGSVKISYS